MKKLVATLFSLLISGSAWALPIGNPWEASIMSDGICWEGYYRDYCDPCSSWCDVWSFRLGFYGDYVFNYHMKVDRSHMSASIHETKISTNAAYLALNLCDQIDIFGTVGASHLSLKTPRSAFGSTSNTWGFVETGSHVSWSIGLRGTIWECGCFGFGAEAQYFRTRPYINYVRAENGITDYRRSDPLKFSEWQIGLGAAYRINIAYCATAFIPYFGIKWSKARVDMENIHSSIADMTLFNLQSERYFGYAIGLTLLGCNKGSVTVEGRFINEKAVYVNGQIRF